ncbi:MAG: hypothetical protein IKA61_00040 [Clostridia bacterium]|nr:hypothetical protein [Clostridia bacterium]
MKKLVKRLALALVCLTLTVSAIACTGNVAEPREEFKGVFSAYDYATEEEAVRAFIENEFTDMDFNGEYLSHSAIADLTAEELDGLNYGTVNKEDITSAKKVEISYSLGGAASKHVAYVLTVGEEDVRYRYYSPKPSDGEGVTQSYVSYLLDKTVLSNVTVEQKTDMSTSSGGLQIDIAATVTCRYAENVIGFTYSESYKYGEQSQTSKFDGAMLMSARGVRAYTLGTNDQYQDSTNDLSALLLIGSDLENSGILGALKQVEFVIYMVKGDKLVLREDIKSLIIEQVAEASGEATIHSYASSFTIDGGRIVSLDEDMEMTAAGQRVKMSIETSFTDYGVTSVSVPQEVLDMNASY